MFLNAERKKTVSHFQITNMWVLESVGADKHITSVSDGTASTVQEPITESVQVFF